MSRLAEAGMSGPAGPAGGSPAVESSEARRQEALSCIEKARELQLDGRVEDAQAEVTNAWFALEESLSLCPTNHRARFLLVSCAMNADDYQRAKAEALRIYTDLSREQLQQMDDSVLHLSLAHASKMLKDVKDAMRYANEACELYPEDPQSYMVLGELYDSVNEDELAEKFCRQAIFYNDAPNCKHPLNAHNVFFSLCCLGGSLIKQQKYSEAEKFLTKAAKVDQDSTLALRHLVEVYAQQDRKEFAILTAKRVVEIETAASTPCEDMKQRILQLEQSAPDGLVSMPRSQELGSVEDAPQTAQRQAKKALTLS